MGNEIEVDIDQIPSPGDHLCFLLPIGHEEFFHQPPFEESTGACHLIHLHPLKLADGGQRTLGSGNQAPFVIVVNEYFDLVVDVQPFGHKTLRQEDFLLLASVQIYAERYFLYHT